jgi:glycosyltransferase involved in cell wall biosynthesis
LPQGSGADRVGKSAQEGSDAAPMAVIVPAHDEAGFIGPCLDAVLASDDPGRAMRVVVAANACRDATVAEAQARAGAFAARGWGFAVLDLAEGGKTRAINAAEAGLAPGIRVYLDADVRVSPPLLAQLGAALDQEGPRYASGRPRLPPPRTAVSRLYGRFWMRLPFLADGVPGFGVFAVNAAGRARWGAFPGIIGDDIFVRHAFSAAERVGVPAPYDWPLTEGFGALVRVRRRQDAGNRQVAALFPDLPGLAEPTAPGRRRLMRLALRDPLGFAVYAAVAAATRLPFWRARDGWGRGR